MRHSITKALWQTPALVLLALIIAMAVNQWRSDGLALVGAPPAVASLGPEGYGIPVVDPAEAQRLFEVQEALFLDARSRDQYAAGHIRGALNLAWPQAQEIFGEVAGRLDGAKTIITYCDGETCTLSHDLAHFLTELGFADVRVLINGWTVWQKSGMPIGKETSDNG